MMSHSYDITLNIGDVRAPNYHRRLAAGMPGRALATADIEPIGTRADSATKAWRERVARDLILQGEHHRLGHSAMRTRIHARTP